MEDFEKEYKERYDIPGFLKTRKNDEIVGGLIDRLTEELCELKQYGFEKRYKSLYHDVALYGGSVRVSYAMRKSYYASHSVVPRLHLEVICDECYCTDQSVREKSTCKCWGNEDCVKNGECYDCTGRCNHDEAKCKCAPLQRFLDNNKTVKEMKLHEALCVKYAALHEQHLKTEREKEEVIYRLKNTGMINKKRYSDGS